MDKLRAAMIKVAQADLGSPEQAVYGSLLVIALREHVLGGNTPDLAMPRSVGAEDYQVMAARPLPRGLSYDWLVIFQTKFDPVEMHQYTVGIVRYDDAAQEYRLVEDAPVMAGLKWAGALAWFSRRAIDAVEDAQSSIQPEPITLRSALETAREVAKYVDPHNSALDFGRLRGMAVLICKMFGLGVAWDDALIGQNPGGRHTDDLDWVYRAITSQSTVDEALAAIQH